MIENKYLKLPIYKTEIAVAFKEQSNNGPFK